MKQTLLNISMTAGMVAMTALAAAAQTYSKDVDVTVELQPELRAASRLDITPATLAKTFPASSLRYSGNAVTMPVTPMINTLPAMAPARIYTPGDTDGYVAGGWFPWANFGVSAGYRLVNTRSTRLDVWGQLNRNRYKEPTLADEDGNTPRSRIATTDFDMGLNFSHSASGGVLSAATSLYLSHFNYPLAALSPSTQNVNRYRLGASWNSTLDENASGYAIEGSLERFGFGKACFPTDFDHSDIDRADPLHELSGRIGASGQLMFTDAFGMGVSLSYAAASASDGYRYMPGENRFHPTGKARRGVVSVGASFRFNATGFSGHIGPVIDIPTGDNHGTHTGARGVLNWNMSRYLLLFTTVESGTSLNTLGSLYDISRYGAPLSAAKPSFLEGDVKAGISVGPFLGVSFTARGGFSSASDWMLPALSDGVSAFAATGLSTAYYSLELDYRLGRCLTVNALFEGAVNNRVNRGYYRWSDRAKQVLDVSLTWHPVDELTIEAGYNLRLGRKICSITTMQTDIERPVSVEYGFKSLGRISQGRIGVSYAFDETVSIFARVEGIGQGRYQLDGAAPGQRLRGLVGAAYSF